MEISNDSEIQEAFHLTPEEVLPDNGIQQLCETL